VINSSPSVREDTRKRVQQAIAELGYRRNVAARTLVTRRSNTIGVITSVSPFWGPSSTLIGVERAAGTPASTSASLPCRVSRPLR